ncbi:MAG: hypothetical protein QN157_11920 [Armatimonadota bacterium]|nr:hypothetical protein [Armatimonadota bacterium]
MTDAELLSRWYLFLALGGVIVAVVALLLAAILMTARRIERAASRCLTAVRQVADRTAAIWELDSTNAVAWELREAARTVRQRAEEIAQALQAPAGPRV